MPDLELQKFSSRLSNLIEELGYTPYAFAKKLGYNRADNVFNALKAKGWPKSRMLADIHLSFEEVNMDWLITNRGNMFVESAHNSGMSVVAESEPDYGSYDELLQKYNVQVKLSTHLEKLVKYYENELEKNQGKKRA